MATLPQLGFAKKLILKMGGDPIDYPMDENTPHSAISPFIDRMKHGQAVGPDEWTKMIAGANENTQQEQPQSTQPQAQPSAHGYDCHFFDEEIREINSLFIRNLTSSLLKAAPAYFWQVPASSTGKYHPDYTNGNGGLARHVKAAFKIAISLFENPSLGHYTRDEKDIALGAILCHDLCKSGLTKQEYTVTDHPLLVKKLVTPEMLTSISDQQLEMFKTMMDCIETHMGPWTRDYKTQKEVLQAPETKLQRFVHMCDYLASRKFIEIKL